MTMTIPGSLNEAMIRMNANLTYYRECYFAFTMVTLVAFLIYWPVLLLLSIIMLIAWYAVFVVKQQPIELPSVGALSTMQELAIMFVGSSLILAFVGVPKTLMYALFSATFGIVSHACLQAGGGGTSDARYAPVSSTENDSLMGGSGGAF